MLKVKIDVYAVLRDHSLFRILTKVLLICVLEGSIFFLSSTVSATKAILPWGWHVVGYSCLLQLYSSLMFLYWSGLLVMLKHVIAARLVGSYSFLLQDQWV